MKTLIAAAVAGAFALPAFAQTSTPSAQEKLPTAEERAKNRETVSSSASNAALTTKVKSALANDSGMGTMTSINVDSDKGVVTLKGKVDSDETKRKVADVARKVDGVKSVNNELQVEKKG